MHIGIHSGIRCLAVPFVRVWSMHGFFFLDLICLLGAYAGFLSFARRVGVGPLAAVPIFLVTTFAYATIGRDLGCSLGHPRWTRR